MYEAFGATVTGNSALFQVFFPDNTVDASQYVRGGLPQISELKVTGNFQSKMGGTDWDYVNAPALTKAAHPNGWLYSLQIDDLPNGFYEYKYFVQFNNGTSRWCSDPCSKYGGFENENSGFVVGGKKLTVRPIQKRLPQEELIIYEVMLDDFTKNYKDKKAPFDAFRDKLDYLQSLGVNAIEFMPWTTWPAGEDFSWGYDPVSFFSVEYNYYNDDSAPLDKLNKLKRLIDDMHARGMHVIMDGVYNHANDEGNPNKGFAYKWLYQEPGDSPYTGNFGQGGYFADVDFGNNCVDDFINDVCQYWIDTFSIDGIRFDYVLGFYVATDPTQGIGEIIGELKKYTASKNLDDFSYMLELLTDNRYDAIGQTDNIDATGCWFDPIMFEMINGANQLDTQVIRALNAGKDFNADKRPVTYIENHDHSTLTSQCGGRANWFVTQPMAIALFTVCGTAFIHNGQEFGSESFIPDDNRVASRPLDWSQSTDGIGQSLGWLYRKLIAIRKAHPALASQNFYPDDYDFSWTKFNSQGYGVDIANGIIIFHRWGNDANGNLERFIIALNFSSSDKTINIPFPANGNWQNLLSDTEEILQVNNFWATNYVLQSHWGKIFSFA